MPKVIVTASGPTGSGKSRVLMEIEIALKAIGIAVTWTTWKEAREAHSEARSEATGLWQPDWPEVVLQEINTPIRIGEGMRRIGE